LGGILASYALIYWRQRTAKDAGQGLSLMVAGSCSVLVAFITLGKVFSPQYCVWLIPIGALANALSTPLAKLAFTTSLALTQVEYPFLYFSFNFLAPATGILILARTVVLWRWTGELFRRSSIRERSASQGDVAEERPSEARLEYS
jgi:hypothetical protein